MFDKCSTEIFINSLKRYMVIFYDLNEDWMSQEISTFTYLENVRSNIYNNNCTPKGYYPKNLWFDVTNSLTILSIMYPTVFFYCYSEVNTDVYIYKFNEVEDKTIIERTHIYTPINV